MFLADGVSLKGRGLDLSNVVLARGGVGGDDLDVGIRSGEIAFGPDLDLTVSIDGGEVEELRVVAGGLIELDIEAEITSSGALEFAADTLIAAFSHTAVQYIADVPVVEVVTLSFIGGFDVDLSDDVACALGGRLDFDVAGGAEHKRGVWSRVWTRTADLGTGDSD